MPTDQVVFFAFASFVSRTAELFAVVLTAAALLGMVMAQDTSLAATLDDQFVLSQQDKLDEAEPYARQALEGFRRVLGGQPQSSAGCPNIRTNDTLDALRRNPEFQAILSQVEQLLAERE